MDFILQIYISQGSVATQLRCGGIFSNHIANVPQNVPVKKLKIGQYLAMVWTKVFSLLFEPPCISDIKNLTCTVLFVSVIFTESQCILSNVKRSHQ